MKRHTKITILSISLIMVAVLTITIHQPSRTVLTFQHLRSGDPLAYLPIHQTKDFQIQYIHSVHLSEVIEGFEIQDDHSIKPTRLVYEDTAIGMPSNAYGDDSFEMKDGNYIITKGPNTATLSSINLAVGQVRSEHTIIYDGRSYLLKEFVGAGTSIRIKVRSMSIWEMWKGVKMSE